MIGFIFLYLSLFGLSFLLLQLKDLVINGYMDFDDMSYTVISAIVPPLGIIFATINIILFKTCEKEKNIL